MAISSIISGFDGTLNDLFFQPLQRSIESLSWRRNCSKFDDDSWLRMGVGRVIDEAGSGRGFLQENCLNFKLWGHVLTSNILTIRSNCCLSFLFSISLLSNRRIPILTAA